MGSGASATSGKKDGGASRKVESGMGVLDNNAVNFLMAFLMSIGGILLASYVWAVPLESLSSALVYAP